MESLGDEMPVLDNYMFVPQQGGSPTEPPAESLTSIHDEIAKSIYSSIDVLTSLLSRTRGAQPASSSVGEQPKDRNILRDAATIRAGAYRVTELANQLSGLI